MNAADLYDDADRVTDIRELGSPCRVLSGCTELEVPGTGRCAWHSAEAMERTAARANAQQGGA